MCRRALSAALEPLTIICQLVRVFDCGRAPCKGHARNQPNRQNARISHRRLASSPIPRGLPGISIPEQLSGQGRRSHDAARQKLLLSLPFDRRRARILHLEPTARAAAAVRRALPLRDDAFEPQLAGVLKHGRTVTLDVVIEPNALARGPKSSLSRRGFSQKRRDRVRSALARSKFAEGRYPCLRQ